MRKSLIWMMFGAVVNRYKNERFSAKCFRLNNGFPFNRYKNEIFVKRRCEAGRFASSGKYYLLAVAHARSVSIALTAAERLVDGGQRCGSP